MTKRITPPHIRQLVAAVIISVAITAAASVASEATSLADEVIPLPTAIETDGTMGTCYAFQEVEGTPLPALAFAAGSRWDRFDFRWNVIEGEEEQLSPLSFEAHDEVVNRDIAYGIDMIGILGSTPKWAAPTCHVLASMQTSADAPQDPPLLPLARNTVDEAYWWRPCPPQGLYLDWDDPANLWGNYVYQTVSHFKDRVHVWEIWNEPDLGQTFWSGSVADYAQLLKVGYQAVKAADPDATVLFAGLAYWSNPSYYIAVLDELQTIEGSATNNAFFDVMSLHLYSNVYQVRPVAAEIQANMASRVGPHPIWLTETGVPIWDEWPSEMPVELRTNRARASEAAAYAIQAFAEARAIGIEKFLFFRTHDDNMSVSWKPEDFGFPADLVLPENFGLIRNDLSLRPGYTAFQVAAQYLQGENQVTGPFSNSGVRRITFWGTPQGRVDVLWNETGSPLTTTHPALLPSARIVDVSGQITQALASAGNFTLTLEAATANTAADGSYLIGGPPLLVIQEDTTPPSSSLRTLPALMYTDTLTLAWDVADEGAGYWYAEVEQATAADGPWTQLLGWSKTRDVTQTVVTLPSAGNWYFRSRVRDGAGNWSPWPTSAELSTTLILTRTVGISATSYLDLNSNSLWDADELPATAATITWQSPAGDPITTTVGATLRVTETVDAGDYLLSAQAPGYLTAYVPFTVQPGTETAHVTLRLGLKEARGRVYLPLLARDS